MTRTAFQTIGRRWSLALALLGLLCPVLGRANPGEILWTFATDKAITSCPALGADGTVFIGSDSGLVTALAPSAGTEKWRYRMIACTNAWVTAGADGVVYCTGFLGCPMYALDEDTGAPKWRTVFEVTGPPAIGYDGTLYVNAPRMGLIALDPATQAWKWQSKETNALAGPPVASSLKSVCFATEDGRFRAVDALSGVASWTYGLNGVSRRLFSASDGVGSLFVPTLNGSVFAIDEPSGGFSWAWTDGSSSIAGVAVGPGNTILFATADGRVVAKHADGTELWTYRNEGWLGGYYCVPAVDAGGTVYVGTGGGRMLFLDAATGRLLKEVAVGSPIHASVSIAPNGRLYFGTMDGRLVAMEGNGPGLAETAWPKCMGNARNTGVSPALPSKPIPHRDLRDLRLAPGQSASWRWPVSETVGERFQWYRQGKPLEDSNRPFLSISNFSESAAGEYYAIASNSFGAITSRVARLDLGYPLVILKTNAGCVVRKSPDLDNYEPGSEVELSATTAPGVIFLGWSGDVQGFVNPVRVKMTGPKTVRPLYRFSPGTLKWTFRTEGEVVSSPAVDPNGVVYFTSKPGTVHAVEAETGAERWSLDIDLSGESSPALSRDGVLYVGGSVRVCALRAADGQLLWRADTSATPTVAPAIGADGKVYVGTWAGDVLAFDALTGVERWRCKANGPVDPAPVIAPDGTVYVCTTKGTIQAIRPDDGGLRWEYSTGAGIFGCPAIGADGTVYSISSGNNLYALEGTNGSLKWIAGASSLYRGPALGPDGRLYVGNQYGVRVFESATGRWANDFPSAREVWVTPAIAASGTVFFASLDGVIHAVQAQTGQEQWTYRTQAMMRSSPAIGDDGTVYIGSDNGLLYAIAGLEGDGLAIGGWPKYQRTSRNTGQVGVNHPPAIKSLGDWTILAGESLNLQVTAFDPDLPNDELRFSLGSSAPPGMTIDAYTGLLQWTPPERQWTSTNWVAVYVEDLERARATNRLTVYVKDPRRLWVSGSGESWQGCPAMGKDGVLFVGSGGGRLRALDGVTGESRWDRFYQSALSPVAIGTDGTLFCSTAKSNLLALDPGTGAQRWQAGLDSAAGAPAVGADGTVYIGTTNGGLYALDPGRGTVAWVFPARGANVGAPATGDDGGIVFVSSDGQVRALDPDGSRSRWTFQGAGSFASSPALGADGTVYAVSSAGRVFALAADTGESRWEVPLGVAVQASPVLGFGGALYIGALNGSVYNLDAATGQERWSAAIGGAIYSPPALSADGTLYTSSLDHRLYALNAATGERSWSYLAGYSIHSAPTIGPNGAVYFGCDDGLLYALKGSSGAGLAATPWPKYQRDLLNSGSGFDPSHNHPPTLRSPSAATVWLGFSLALTNSALDLDLPANNLWFDLIAAPEGVTLDATNGILQWTPIRPQASTNHAITIRVTDDGIPPLSATNSIVVTVLRSNLPPVLEPIADQRVKLGETLLVDLRGSDPDGPAEDLRYRLGVDAPVGMTLDARTGTISWTAPMAISLATNSVTVELVDGEGGRAARTFLLSVVDQRLRWRFTGQGSVTTSPAIGPDGEVYFSCSAGKLYSLNGTDGSLLWMDNAAGNAVCSPVLGTNDLVYIGDKSNGMAALDRRTGTPRWRSQTDGWPNTPALAPDGALCFITTASNLYVLDGDSGHLRWSVPVGSAHGQIPALGISGEILLGSGDVFRALDAANGRPLWEAGVAGQLFGPPSLGSDGVVYFGTFDGRWHALRRRTGEPVWSVATQPGLPTGAAVAKNGTLFMGAPDGTIRALRGDTGEEIWRFQTLAGVIATPALAADGTVYAASYDSRLYALASTDGRLKWSFTASGALAGSPALAPDGTVYVVTLAGQFFAVREEGASGLASAPWPKFQGNNRNTGSLFDQQPNRPPTLPSTPDRTIDEEDRFVLQLSAIDPDEGAERLAYELLEAPSGMTIARSTGLIEWTPTEAQGPSTNLVVARVSDGADPGLSDTNRFAVEVKEVNRPPNLTTEPRVFTTRTGETLSIANTAVDLDWPANSLSFLPDLDFPSGASLVAATGVFTWAIPPDLAGTTNRFTLRVTDSGAPELSASVELTVIALPALAAPRVESVRVDASNQRLGFSWMAVGGVTYRVQSSPSLDDPRWTDEGGPVIPDGAIATFQVELENGGQRYYRVLLVDEL